MVRRVPGAERDDRLPEVVPARRAGAVRAVMLVVAGTLALVVDAVAGGGLSPSGALLGALGGGLGVAFATAATISATRRRADAAMPVAPEAVRVEPLSRTTALRAAAGVALLVAVSVLLNAWWDGELPPGVLWIVMGLGAGAEVVALRAWEREHGGALAAVRGPRRVGRSRLRSSFRSAGHVVLRPRVDVTVGDAGEPRPGPSLPHVAHYRRPVARALVLGAGGLAAIAWETGLLAGLARRGVDLAGVGLVVGTSAGSTVAAQLGGPRSLEELVAAQLDAHTDELPPGDDPGHRRRREEVWETLAAATDPLEGRRRAGRIALATPTVPEPVRRAVIEARLAGADWPARPLRIPAVDADSGELVVFDRDAGVPLVDAVAASCAVPAMWPPVTIGGRRYVDGGVRSGTNVDLAAAAERVVVLQAGEPRPDEAPEAVADPLRVLVLRPTEAFAAARGDDPLDPAVRPGCVRAGLDQAEAVVDLVRAHWAAAR
jgi:NTE family protein